MLIKKILRLWPRISWAQAFSFNKQTIRHCRSDGMKICTHRGGGDDRKVLRRILCGKILLLFLFFTTTVSAYRMDSTVCRPILCNYRVFLRCFLAGCRFPRNLGASEANSSLGEEQQWRRHWRPTSIYYFRKSSEGLFQSSEEVHFRIFVVRVLARILFGLHLNNWLLDFFV